MVANYQIYKADLEVERTVSDLEQGLEKLRISVDTIAKGCIMLNWLKINKIINKF